MPRGFSAAQVGALSLPLFWLLVMVVSVATKATAGPTTVVELRQYTLRSGQRGVLVDLFEQEFIESQEALGMNIVGTFRDLDQPDHFVWIRGFDAMSSRADSLKAFYEGPVWRTHGRAANATMLDSSNVLLLHAAGAGSSLSFDPGARAAKGARENPGGLVIATIYYFDAAPGNDFAEYFKKTVMPHLGSAGITVRGAYLTEATANNFPRLPVRSDQVFVWFAVYRDAAHYQQSLKRLSAAAEWPTVAAALRAKLRSEPEMLQLEPTPRSALHK